MLRTTQRFIHFKRMFSSVANAQRVPSNPRWGSAKKNVWAVASEVQCKTFIPEHQTRGVSYDEQSVWLLSFLAEK